MKIAGIAGAASQNARADLQAAAPAPRRTNLALGRKLTRGSVRLALGSGSDRLNPEHLVRHGYEDQAIPYDNDYHGAVDHGGRHLMGRHLQGVERQMELACGGKRYGSITPWILSKSLPTNALRKPLPSPNIVGDDTDPCDQPLKMGLCGVLSGWISAQAETEPTASNNRAVAIAVRNLVDMMPFPSIQTVDRSTCVNR
jgi:hypothetical protein